MTAANPLSVSVALCTCNGEKFVRAQLDSIVKQTRPPAEIIVCDDRSEDSTVQIIKDFAASSPVPVRWEINPVRLGVTRNFEKTIGLTSGEIIFLADQDDFWHPEKIERTVNCFSNPAVSMVFSNGRVVADDLSSLGYTLWDSVWFDAGEQRRVMYGDALPVLLRHAIAAGATLAFRGSYKAMILPIPNLPHCHDIWITLLLACAGNIYPLNENLIDYRLHASNQVGLKKHGLISQLRMAKWQLRFGAFQYAVDLHQAAIDRLKKYSLLKPEARKLLNEKIEHSRIRHEMPGNWFARLPIVWRETRGRKYALYSYGYKSVLQDLFLR